MLKPFYCFFDPSFIANLNKDNWLVLNSFCNRINKIEDMIFNQGDSREFFRIPVNDIFDRLLEDIFRNLSSKSQYNVRLSKNFTRQYHRILKRLFEYWNESSNEEGEIYKNSIIDSKTVIDFNNFLKGCISIVSFSHRGVEFSHSNYFPIFITKETVINNSRYKPFNQADELLMVIPAGNINLRQEVQINLILAERRFGMVITLEMNQGTIESYSEIGKIINDFAENYNIDKSEVEIFIKNLQPTRCQQEPQIKLVRKEPTGKKEREQLARRLVKKFPYITEIRDGAWNSSGQLTFRIPPNQIQLNCSFRKDFNYSLFVTTTAKTDCELLIIEQELKEFLKKK